MQGILQMQCSKVLSKVLLKNYIFWSRGCRCWKKIGGGQISFFRQKVGLRHFVARCRVPLKDGRCEISVQAFVRILFWSRDRRWNYAKLILITIKVFLTRLWTCWFRMKKEFCHLYISFFYQRKSWLYQRVLSGNHGRDISTKIGSGRVEIEIGMAILTFWQIRIEIGKGNPSFPQFFSGFFRLKKSGKIEESRDESREIGKNRGKSG